MEIQNYHSTTLHIDSFKISPGEAWCIYGGNNSGISDFVHLFSSEQQMQPDVYLDKMPTVISFAKQQEIFEEELRRDNTDFLDRIDPGTPAQEFISNLEQHQHLVKTFNLQDCLEKGYRQLSSGESRKLMLLAALSQTPRCLLIENPYDGIDKEGCRELDRTLSHLHRLGYQIIITVNNPEDIPEWASHLALIENGSLCLHGPRKEMLSLLNSRDDCKTSISLRLDKVLQKVQPEEILVELRNGFARYGETVIFSHLQFRVMSNQHTLITGPNGSGKSTLLQIITGDNQNCYGNNLHVFGHRRGSGESIWELKKQMGIVSPDLHRNHYIPGSALQVVISGFFDSIGVYTQCSSIQQQEALRWLEMIGLRSYAQHSFRSLSYANQRLCLIARALIKMPRLLILDEPTQGLDKLNRNSILDFLETIVEQRLSTILYASHRTDEFRHFFKQHVDLSSAG